MEKKSEKEIKQEVEQRLREIALFREEAQNQGLKFSSLTEEQIVKKVKLESSKSPYIFSKSWTSGTTPGSLAYYTIYISNPDPVGYYPMFASVFFGLGNFLGDIGQGWIGRDTRWPVLSTPSFSLAAGATTTKTFNYTIPTGVPLTTYIGNSVIWKGDYEDVGKYFDRGIFDVTLH